mmetsp:Transcript_13494/g.29210  ORF Transcript_13494/g.29210 Transcript_13494/m.29210 type:complete len:144 (+) Transcript_13494:160-591(+)
MAPVWASHHPSEPLISLLHVQNLPNFQMLNSSYSTTNLNALCRGMKKRRNMTNNNFKKEASETHSAGVGGNLEEARPSAAAPQDVGAAARSAVAAPHPSGAEAGTEAAGHPSEEAAGTEAVGHPSVAEAGTVGGHPFEAGAYP